MSVHEELSWADFVEFINRAWKFVIAAGASGALIAGLYLLITPPHYEAAMQLRMTKSINNHVGSADDKQSTLSYIESPAELSERLKFVTAYPSGFLRKCGVTQSEEDHSNLDGFIKAALFKGVDDLVEINLRTGDAKQVESCANEVFKIIRDRQEAMLERVLNLKREELLRLREAIASEQKMSREFKLPSLAGFTYLIERDSLLMRQQRERQLVEEISFAPTGIATLWAPIHASGRPMHPNAILLLSLGAIAGLMFGMIIAAFRYRRT